MQVIYSVYDSGINSLHDLANQDEVAYGTIEASSSTVLLSKYDTEPYATIYPHLMDNLVPNASVGIEKVRKSYGIGAGNVDHGFYSCKTPPL